jgi:hypothetical protein
MPTDPKLLEQLNRKIRNTGFEEKAAWSTADYIRETALDIPRGLAGGVVGFTQSAGSLLDAGFEAVGLEGFDDEILSSSYRPDSIRTKTVFGGFVDTTAQFVTGLVLGGGALKVTGAARGAAGLLARSGRIGATIAESKIAKAAGYGAVADFLAFQGDEGRAADFLVSLGGVGDNVVTRYLATDKEDPWLEARFKNVVEGALLGVAFDTALKGVGAAVQSGVVKPLEARRALREMFPEMTATELKKLDEGIPSEVKGSGPDEDEFDEIIDEPLDEDGGTDRQWVRSIGDTADDALPEEAQDAVTRFVAHGPKGRDADDSMRVPIMSAWALEDAFSREPSSAGKKVREQLDAAMAPVREKLRQRFGPTVRLYRAQQPVPENVKPRNVLSWTLDPKVADSFAGVEPGALPMTDAEIDALVKAFEEKGEVRVGRTIIRHNAEDGRVDLYSAADEYGDESLITDIFTTGTPSDAVRSHFMQEREYAEELLAKNTKRRQRIIQRDVPVEDIVWITDRANQAEFIVRTSNSTPTLTQSIQSDYKAGTAAGLSPEEALQEGFNLHINYRHILNTDDAVKAMRAAEKVAEDIINTRIGDVQSNAETARLATEMGLDPEQLINALKTNADATRNAAAQYVAGRSLRSAFAEQAASLAQRFEAVARGEVDGDAVALQEELLKATSALINVDTIVGEVQKQAARVVQAGNIDVGDAADLAAVDADDILAAIRGEATPGAEAAMRAAQKAADEGNAALAEILREVAEESAPALPPAPTRTGGTPDAPAADATTPPAGPAAAPPSQAAPTGAAPQTGTAAPSQPSQGAAPAAAPTAGGAPTGQTPTQGAAPAPITPQIPSPRPAQGRVNPQTVRLAGAIAQAHRTGQTARIVKQAVQAKKAGLFDVFLEYYKASILSGIPTFMINGVSGGLNTMLQAASKLAGSAASLDWKETQRSFRLMVNVVGAMGDLVKYTMFTTPGDGPKGLRTVARTIKTETPTLTEATAIEGVQAIKAETFGLSNQGIAGKSVNAVGRFIRLPFAVNQAGEEMWSQLNYLAFVRTKAAEAADTAIWKNPNVPAGQKEAAALAFVDAYIKDAFDSMGAAKALPSTNPQAAPKFLHEDAVKYAQSVNYTQDLVAGIGQSLTKFKQEHRWMDLIIPFIKAPTNLVRQGIRMTPGLHLLDRRFAKRFLSRNRDEVMRARGELLLGSALWGTAVYLSATGQITGGGPLNREERAALLATGWRPYSFVKVKADGSKEYVEYRRFDPLAMIFGISADFAEAGAYLQDSERDAFGKAAVLALANNITSKTYLQGLSETIRAITRPDMSGGQYLKNRIGALVPTFFARYTTSDDQYMREARSVLDAMRRRLPGLSQDLPPRRNILGEPITPTAGFIPFTNTTTPGTANRLSRMMSPAAFSRSVNDVVVQELAALSYGFSMPSVRMDGVDLTTVRTPSGQEAYDRYVELSGTVKINDRTLSQQLNAVINSSSYQKLPMPQSRGDALNPRIQLVQRVISAYRSRAKAELMRESPELRDAIFEIRRTARVGGSRNPILERLQAQ